MIEYIMIHQRYYAIFFKGINNDLSVALCGYIDDAQKLSTAAPLGSIEQL